MLRAGIAPFDPPTDVEPTSDVARTVPIATTSACSTSSARLSGRTGAASPLLTIMRTTSPKDLLTEFAFICERLYVSATAFFTKLQR
jgi:hypothetical protein